MTFEAQYKEVKNDNNVKKNLEETIGLKMLLKK